MKMAAAEEKNGHVAKIPASVAIETALKSAAGKAMNRNL